MLSHVPPGVVINLLTDIFPTPKEIDNMLSQLSPDPIDATLAVMDPLIPPASAFASTSDIPPPYDTRGFSSYARVVDALLQVFGEDRQSAKKNTWVLRHFLAFEVYAQDFMNVPSAQSPVFEQKALAAGLDDAIARVRQVTTYVLTSGADSGWRGAALGAVLEDKAAGEIGALPTLLVDAIRLAREQDFTRNVRVLRIVLDHVFHDMEKEESDHWMLLARKIESTGECFSFFRGAFVVSYC
jgi:E3 ubiquitin-protein ligase listerin